MQSILGDVLSPEGWSRWNNSYYALDTMYYAEYNNTGSGAKVQNRVKWQGFHIRNESNQAINFTVARLISGDQWLNATGVPYTSGF